MCGHLSNDVRSIEGVMGGGGEAAAAKQLRDSPSWAVVVVVESMGGIGSPATTEKRKDYSRYTNFQFATIYDESHP